MQQRFLLCYDNCIVEIDFEWDWQLTSEQMTVVTENLKSKICNTTNRCNFHLHVGWKLQRFFCFMDSVVFALTFH